MSGHAAFCQQKLLYLHYEDVMSSRLYVSLKAMYSCGMTYLLIVYAIVTPSHNIVVQLLRTLNALVVVTIGGVVLVTNGIPSTRKAYRLVRLQELLLVWAHIVEIVSNA